MIQLDPRKGPKGKVPWIEDQGRTIADSAFIIEYLKEAYGDRLGTSLGAEERATPLALQRLIEEHLYWTIAHGRFMNDEVWPTTKGPFLAAPDDLYRLGCDDLTALSTFLGDKPYFFGDEPTELDATAYGFLAQVLWAPGARRLREHMQQTRNLPAFCERIKLGFYGGAQA